MLVPPLRIPLIEFACLLTLTSCTSDKAALNKFSRSYAAFLTAEQETMIISYEPVVNEEKAGTYWPELEGAAKIRSTDEARLRHATNALRADSILIHNTMDEFSLRLDKLDASVNALFESANAIHNQEYRSDAITIATQARTIASDFVAIRELYADSFALRRKFLSGIVEGRGGQPVSLLQTYAPRISQMADSIEMHRSDFSASLTKLKDTFSALRGQSGMISDPPTGM